MGIGGGGVIIITCGGLPYFDSGKFNTCQSAAEAQAECDRLAANQAARNANADRIKAGEAFKGRCFLTVKKDYKFGWDVVA